MCCTADNRFPQLDRELHFGYQKNGSLVVAFNSEDEAHLEELLARGMKNGVQRLRIVKKDELMQMEPYLNPAATAALYSPDAGNLIPYEYAIALAENAVDNGVELRVRREVTAIYKCEDGSFVVHADHWEPQQYVESVLDDKARGHSYSLSISIFLVATAVGIVSKYFLLPSEKKNGVYAPLGSGDVFVTSELAVTVAGVLALLILTVFSYRAARARSSGASIATTLLPVGAGGRAVTVDEMRVGGSGSCTANKGRVVDKESFKTRFVVNCAGGQADKISALVGDTSFKIKPRLGDYIILSRDQGKFAKHTIFPCPGPLGKGVLVQTTLWGMLILGPTARDTHLPEVMAESAEDIQKFILHKCRALVPSFDPKDIITSFCGARAKSTRGDWIIEPSGVAPNFIQAAGIDSPGIYAFLFVDDHSSVDGCCPKRSCWKPCHSN